MISGPLPLLSHQGPRHQSKRMWLYQHGLVSCSLKMIQTKMNVQEEEALLMPSRPKRRRRTTTSTSSDQCLLNENKLLED